MDQPSSGGIILAQVFYRYVLNDSLGWSEEVAKIMMVWSAFLVAPWAYRQGANVSIDMFVEAFPLLARRLMETVLNLLVLFIVAWGIMVAPFDWDVGGLDRRPVATDAIPDSPRTNLRMSSRNFPFHSAHRPQFGK